MKKILCPNCRSEIKWGTTTLDLKRGSFETKVKGVPAQLCKNCGEVFIPGKVAESLSSFAEKTFAEVKKAKKELLPT